MPSPASPTRCAPIRRSGPIRRSTSQYRPDDARVSLTCSLVADRVPAWLRVSRPRYIDKRVSADLVVYDSTDGHGLRIRRGISANEWGRCASEGTAVHRERCCLPRGRACTGSHPGSTATSLPRRRSANGPPPPIPRPSDCAPSMVTCVGMPLPATREHTPRAAAQRSAHSTADVPIHGR